MLSIPNLLSLSRIPLALVFLQESPMLRTVAICLAMITDGLDGYLARRRKLTSQVGTLLDPLSDKFFVFFTLGILVAEHPLPFWKISAMLCRDFSIILFGTYLALTGHLAHYRFRAIWCGKITTVLQLLVLMSMTLHIEVPSFIFISFIIFGVLALVELYYSKEKPRPIDASS